MAGMGPQTARLSATALVAQRQGRCERGGGVGCCDGSKSEDAKSPEYGTLSLIRDTTQLRL
eukprot:11360-Chlamydomonas_euryale.AAC.1